MAVTKIWPIHENSNIKLVIEYVEDEEKTTIKCKIVLPNEKEYTDDESQNFDDVINYTMNEKKTMDKVLVTGINCNQETAREEMLVTKARFLKQDGIILWHGIQSFFPGEITPEKCHEIGLELSKKLWPDHEVIVSTHIDKKHIHNHFVINSVSMVNGKKLDAKWQEMARESDKLCEKYNLSIIKDPKFKGKHKHISLVRAESEGRATWISVIKSDIDDAISISKNYEEFKKKLKEKGYEFKDGAKYFTLRPAGKDRFVRVDRRLGEDYKIDNIKATILDNVKKNKVKALPEQKIIYARGRTKKPNKSVKGIKALYYYYCYQLGVFGNKPKRNTNYLIKEEMRNIDLLSKETRYIAKNNITTTDDLDKRIEVLDKQLESLRKERATYRNKEQLKSGNKEEIKEIIDEINIKIKHFKKELYLCKDIKERAKILSEKKQSIYKKEQEPGKELKKEQGKELKNETNKKQEDQEKEL